MAVAVVAVGQVMVIVEQSIVDMPVAVGIRQRYGVSVLVVWVVVAVGVGVLLAGMVVTVYVLLVQQQHCAQGHQWQRHPKSQRWRGSEEQKGQQDPSQRRSGEQGAGAGCADRPHRSHV